MTGVLVASREHDDPEPFDHSDLEFVRMLAERATVALDAVQDAVDRARVARTLDAMFDASPLATQLLASDGTVLLWNRAAERLFGYSRDEAIGHRPPTIPPDQVPAAAEMLTRVLGGDLVEGLPARRLRKDGSELDVLLYGSAVPGEHGETRVLGIYADMTEQHRLEDELRRATDALRAILDASPLAIIAVDLDLRVTFWSRGAERLFGWTADEAMGQVPPHISGDALATLRDQVATMRASGRDDELLIETNRQTRDGRLLDVNVHLVPMRGADGEVAGLLTVQEDVTERKRLEAELAQSQKMETVGTLAGGIAHDFNNILMAIIGFASMAAADTEEDRTRQALRVIEASANRAADLTHQLLAFSRRQMLTPAVHDVNDMVAEAEAILRRLIGENIDLVCSLRPGAGSVRVDRGQFNQVILNLAVNARDAMPDGGRLLIRTDVARFSEASAHLEMEPGEYVVLSVSDSGQGMDKHTQSRIFEPFFTTKGMGKGTGLGLSTVYGIVRQSGGHVWVYSEPGVGADFRVYLPRVAGDPVPAVLATSAAARDLTGVVLLVEDEQVLRQLGATILKRQGFTVRDAATPVEALAIAESEPQVDLLVSDVVMPGMTGVELARRLRATRPELPVVLMSGYSEDVAGAGSVANAFLAKPFTPATLVQAAMTVLDRTSGSEPGTA